MKNICKKAASLLLVTMILLSMVVTGVVAEAAAPTEVKSCEKSGLWTTVLSFEFSDTTWLDAVNGVTVNGTAYTNQTIGSFSSDTGIWCVGNATGAYGSYKALQLAIENDASFPMTVEVTAAGYNKLTMEVAKTTVSYNDVYTATVKTPEVEPSTPPTEPEEDKDAPTNFTVSSNGGYDFALTFEDAGAWLDAITSVAVDGTSWEKGISSFSVWNNKKYYADSSSGKLYIGEGFVNDTAVCVITAEGYKPLTLTLNKTNHTAVVGTSTPTAPPTTEPSEEPKPVEDKDPPTEFTSGSYFGYDFQITFENGEEWLEAVTDVEINGTAWKKADNSFDVSSNDYYYIRNSGRILIGEGFEGDTATCVIKATGYKPLTLTLNKTNHSAVIASTEEPTKTVDIKDVTLESDAFGNDWNIKFAKPDDYVKNVTDFKVNGVSWTRKSYAPSSGGAYYKDADNNLITIAQKSYSTSENEVPVRSGDVITISAKGYEDLNLKFVVDKDGKASLVADDGEGDPLELHVKIEGSFEAAIVGQKDYDGVSGASTGGSTSNNNSNVTVYGALTEKGTEPTENDWVRLDSSDSTIENRIDLNDSKVSIVSDVENGTPEDVDCGQIRLADGAVLENAAIYSHANYLANGDTADRTTSAPVVVTNGNVTVKGQVFIEGDEAGSKIGQTALQVNGTLNLEDGATLVAYGGGATVIMDLTGGTAIDLNGTITGNGKLVAIGGQSVFGNGGTAVSGSGTISTSEVFLQGAMASDNGWSAKPGKALNGDITLTSPSRHVKDGENGQTGADDPLKELYWKTGIELTPPLDKFTTEQHEDAVTDTTVWKFDENTHWNPCDDTTCGVHVNEAAHTFVWVNDEAESGIRTMSAEAGTKHEECTVCGYTRNENTPITPEPIVTPEPSAEPTTEPTATPAPTAEPTTEPTATPAPTAEPTAEPTAAPSAEPTAAPTTTPTATPSAAATATPAPTNNNNGSNTPKTGSDYTAVIFSVSLLAVSGAAITVLAIYNKKRGKHAAK